MKFSQYPALAGEKKPQYRQKIAELKEKYKGKIDLFCGLEFEMCSDLDELDYPYEYVIASMHYFNLNGQHWGFDGKPEAAIRVLNECFGGDGLKMAKTYYETFATIPKLGKFDIIGHFDLIAKHSDFYDYIDVNAPEYKSAAIDCIRELVKEIPVFEVNMGGIPRGYRKTPYLAPFMIKEIARLGGGVVISSDCHNKELLTYGFDDAVEYVRSCGVNELLLFDGKQFIGQKI
jgi:histidinol-phosphatase (PHP family)